MLNFSPLKLNPTPQKICQSQALNRTRTQFPTIAQTLATPDNFKVLYHQITTNAKR